MDITHFPHPWINLARLATLFLTAFLAWITYRSNLLLKEIRPDFNLLLSPLESIVRIVIVGLCLLLAWTTGLPAARLGLAMVNPLRSAGLGLAAGVVIQITVNLLTVWAINRFGRHIYSSWVVRNILPRRPVEWMLVPLALLPAVAMEELLFRTLWIGAFREVISVALLVLGTSVVFGVMHLPQGYLGVIVAGSVNILLSLLFLWSGGLLAPLVAHYTINLLQIIVAHFQRDWLENY